MYKKTLVAAMAALVCTAAVFTQEQPFEQQQEWPQQQLELQQQPQQQQVQQQQVSQTQQGLQPQQPQPQTQVPQQTQQQQMPQQQQQAVGTVAMPRNINMYGKFLLSKESRTKDSWTMKMDGESQDGDGKSKLTVITPTFGAVGKHIAFEFGLGFGVGETGEISSPDLDLTGLSYDEREAMAEYLAVFESLSGASVYAIIPRADLVWHLPDPDSFIVPFARFGIGVPIQIGDTVDNDDVTFTSVRFEVSAGFGLLVNVTERIGLVMDTRFMFGPSNGYAVSLGTRFKR